MDDEPRARAVHLVRRARVRLLGVTFDCVDAAQAAERVGALARARDGARVVLTAALRDLARASYDGATRAAFARAAAVLPGSASVARLADLVPEARGAVREVVRPVALLWALAELSAREGLGLFLLGGAPGAAARAALALERGAPGARVVGTLCPRSTDAEPEDARVASIVRASRADVLVVDVGARDPAWWTTERAARFGAPVSVVATGALAHVTTGDDPPSWRTSLAEGAAFLALAARALVAAPPFGAVPA